MKLDFEVPLDSLMKVLNRLSDPALSNADAESYVAFIGNSGDASLQIDLGSAKLDTWASTKWPKLDEDRKLIILGLWEGALMALFDMWSQDVDSSHLTSQMQEVLSFVGLKLVAHGREQHREVALRFDHCKLNLNAKITELTTSGDAGYNAQAVWNAIDLDRADSVVGRCMRSPERLEECRRSKMAMLRMLRRRMQHALSFDDRASAEGQQHRDPLPLFTGKGMADHLFEPESYVKLRDVITAFTALTPDMKIVHVRLIQKRFELMALIEVYNRMLEILRHAKDIVAALKPIAQGTYVSQADVEKAVERCLVEIGNMEWACRRTWQYQSRYNALHERKIWTGKGPDLPLMRARAPAPAAPGAAPAAPDAAPAAPAAPDAPDAAPAAPAAPDAAGPDGGLGRPPPDGSLTVTGGSMGASSLHSLPGLPALRGDGRRPVAGGAWLASGGAPDEDPDEDGEAVRLASSDIQRMILSARSTLRKVFWEVRRAISDVLQMPMTPFPPHIVHFCNAGMTPRLEGVLNALQQQLQNYLTIRADDDGSVKRGEDDYRRELMMRSELTPGDVLAYRFSDLGVQLLYALKVVRFGCQVVALRAAAASYSELFNQRVHAEGGAPPHLSRLLYMFLGIDATLQLMALLALVVFSYGLPVPAALSVDLKKLREQEKRKGYSDGSDAPDLTKNSASSFVLDDDFIASFLADYFMSTVALLAFGLLFGQLFRKKRYFDLASLGGTTVLAYRHLMLATCAVVGLVPFWMLL
jgi:hypothetical protein